MATSADAPEAGACAAGVRVRDFHLWYAEFHALKGISADFPEGRITALVGPSGCGKTTLLRSINRINERSGNVKVTGRIEVLGADVFAPEVSLASLRRDVGMVFQRPNPLPISIYENVVFGLRAHVARHSLGRERLDAEVEAALTRVGLFEAVKDRLGGRAVDLTLEEQQKLCIARLLPLEPRILLMDEPCSALDAKGIAQIESLLAELREHYTILIVTHSMAQARRVSDRSIYMLLGEIVEQAPTRQLFENPSDDRTAQYLAGRYG